MLIKSCKIFLLATMALFFTFVGFTNLVDFNTNYAFVQHVLSMDTIFPNSTTVDRAITSPVLHQTAYGAIIFWECFTALICWIATLRLIPCLWHPERFVHRKQLAIVGLTMGFALYALGFIVIGSEWFQMWQSTIWNGKATAGQFIDMIGIVLLIFFAPDDFA